MRFGFRTPLLSALTFSGVAVLLACGGDDDGADSGFDAGRDSSIDAPRPDAPVDGGADVPQPDTGPPSMFVREVLESRGPMARVTHVRTFPTTPSAFAVFDAFAGTIHQADCSGATCTLSLLFQDNNLFPAVGSIVDFENDGDQDIVYAGIGATFGILGALGGMELLENDGAGGFTPRRLLDGTSRAVCAETGDLDGDGDLDVLVCEFGMTSGRLGWIEIGDGPPSLNTIHTTAGVSHAHAVDLNGDDDLDIVEIRSQVEEVVVVYDNDGSGNFTPTTILDEEAFFGLSDLFPVDIDGDDDIDLLLSNGDAFDGIPVGMDPAALHGITIMENDGAGNFTRRDIVRFWGCYAARPGDIDLDGDLDIVVVTHQDQIMFPANDPMPGIWLENMGDFNFEVQNIPEVPAQSQTLDMSDVDADGDLDIMTGTTVVMEPTDTSDLVLLRNGLR